MTSSPHDIAALFDPASYEDEPTGIPLGTLPPSWANPANHTPAAPTVPPAPTATPAAVPEPADDGGWSDSDEAPQAARGTKKTKRKKSDWDKQVERARREHEKTRKKVRLQLTGVTGNVTRTRHTQTAWFWQPPGPWNMRPVGVQRRFIQEEALVLANLADLGIEHLHRRLVRTPWPVRQWAKAHNEWADPIPDVPGALSWEAYLEGQQKAMLWSDATLKGRYWGIELPQRSALGTALDGAARTCDHLTDAPMVGPVARAVRRWADEAAERERLAQAELLGEIERTLSGAGVRARPATPAQMDYLLRRSATIGLPLDAEGFVAGAGDWEEDDIAALEDLTDIELTPGDGYTKVSGLVGGQRYTGYVIVLTIGRMASLPIPERMMPWQVLGDPSGEPIEWSERIHLLDKRTTIRKMRKVTDLIEAQFDHYTVQHDQIPPQEMREQHALAQQIISDVEEDHSGLSTRTEGWYRMAVVGTTADEVREKVSMLREMYAPHISLEQEHGQFQLLREFIPGEPLANTAHRRRMSVEAVSAGMAAVGDRIGDRRGVVIGETSSIAPRPATWDLFAAHEKKHKSGLTPVVAGLGAGKSFLAGMIVYQAVRAGAYAVILDPSGPLKALAALPEFRDVARVYALTGRTSRPGALNPYRVIPDPDPNDPEFDPTNPEYAQDPDKHKAAQAAFDAAVRAAEAERISVAVSVLKMMLSPARLAQEWTESVLHTAANKVGGQRHHNLREVLDEIKRMADDRDHMDVAATAASIYSDLNLMADLEDARVLFPPQGSTTEDVEDFTKDEHLTVLTMPGLQLPPVGVDASQWTPQQRMAGPLMHMAAWLANRLIYEKPRHVRKVLFLDENKYLEQTGAGRTLNLRIARDSRKYKVRALVCSQLPEDFLGIDGGDDKAALTYEVIIGDIGGNERAIKGALKLLNLPEGQGYEQILARLGSGGEDTLDEDTDTTDHDRARKFVVKMADDIELIRSDWTHFTHLAHVFEALNSAAVTPKTLR